MRVSSAQTDGAYAIIELRLPPGVRVPRHRLAQAKGLVLLRGEVDIAVSKGAWRLTPGQWAYVPQRAAHGLVNPGPDAAHLLEVLWPGGHDELLAALAALPGGMADRELRACFAKHDAELLEPFSLPVVAPEPHRDPS